MAGDIDTGFDPFALRRHCRDRIRWRSFDFGPAQPAAPLLEEFEMTVANG
jgi:hypothetical protein